MEDDTLYDKVTLPLTDIAPNGGDTPLLLALLLLVFFPPAAWYVMWKEEGFDHWLGYLIGFYGILAIVVSFITKSILQPQITQFYLTNHLQEPAISPLSYLTVYYLIGFIEIIFSVVLYFIHDIHKKLPRNWLIAGVIGLAISSLIPFTFIFLTYTAFNNLVEQTKIQRLTPQSEVSPQLPSNNKQEYSSEKLGISFNYPSDYSIIDESATGVSLGMKATEGYLTLLKISEDKRKFVPLSSLNPCKLDPKDDFTLIESPCLTNENGGSTYSPSSIKVDNRVGVSAYISYGVDNDFQVVQFPEPQPIELKMNISGGGLHQLFRNILMNFKFISANPTSTPATSSSDSDVASITEKAKNLLVEKLQSNSNEITLVSETKKSWPDGSLGCPKPGMMYAQHVVDGYQIILKANNNQYDYHAANSVDSVFLCEK